jgi:hypothetical protein
MSRDQLDRRPEHLSHNETEGEAPTVSKGSDTPGDAAGVVVPNEDAMPGTSQEFRKADGGLVYPDPDEPAT